MYLAELCAPWKGDTRSPMDPRLNLGLCKGICVPPCPACPGKFLYTSLTVSVPRCHDMLLSLGSDVDMSGRLWDDLWFENRKYSLGSIDPRTRPLSVWTTIKCGFLLIKTIVRHWCGRRLWWIERNWNLGSKDFWNVWRRRLSASEMYHYLGFHFDLM